jgi:Glycosyltransferase
LAKCGIDFKCELIGEGPLRPEIEAGIARHNLQPKVTLAGEQSQMKVLEALASCDIFVLASEIDARGASDVFPTVIAEAMASGKPVVSTIVAGIPELVANEETGLLVPPNDPFAIANALGRLAGDQNYRDRLGRAARERIEDNFVIQKTIEPLLQRFEGIACSV